MQSKRKKSTKPKISIRTLTITDYHYPVNYGHYTNFVPFIRLRGNWLTKAGFQTGQKIKVLVSKKRLIIIPKKKNEL